MPISILQELQDMAGKPPEEAKFFWSGGPVEVAERTWFQSFFSGVTGFETEEGLVLIDSGLEMLAGTLAGMLRQKSQAPIHTVILTQGHVDHAFGIHEFLQADQTKPRVVAHRAMPARFDRYTRTSGHNQALNARQFGGTVEANAQLDTFKAPKIPPDVLYEEALELVVGGLRFEVYHCRGETDDHSWIYCPQRGVLCPGDLFIWGVPNAGNPQKVQRYPWEWAAGLRAMAAKSPRTMCPGHGGPVIDDAERVQHMLHSTADFLDTIVQRTLAVMNEGSPPHVDIVRAVELPQSDEPWLQNIYDDAEFIIRNVIRYYGGWWSGRPSDLKPAPREAVAAQLADLAGGARKLLERARTLDDPRCACALADLALEAAPQNKEVQEAVAQIYEARAQAESSLMANNIFSSAAAYARAGRPYR